MKQAMQTTALAKSAIVAALIFATSACTTPVKLPVKCQYKLASYASEKSSHHKSSHSILISKPDAISGYQTEQMLYMKKPYQLASFAHNAWLSPPAAMLYPLIIQSIDASQYFAIVASSPYSDKTDYRLDTQLIQLQQNFLEKPSTLLLTVKAVLTHVEDNRAIASHIFYKTIPCTQDTPYAGVIAANKATHQLTHELTQFIIASTEKNK